MQENYPSCDLELHRTNDTRASVVFVDFTRELYSSSALVSVSSEQWGIDAAACSVPHPILLR